MRLSVPGIMYQFHYLKLTSSMVKILMSETEYNLIGAYNKLVQQSLPKL